MSIADLNHIQFYFPPPSPPRRCAPRTSAGPAQPTGGVTQDSPIMHPVATPKPLFKVPTSLPPPFQQFDPLHLPQPPLSAESGAQQSLPESPELSEIAPDGGDQQQRESSVFSVDFVNLTGDSPLSPMWWESDDEPHQSPVPGNQLPLLKETYGSAGDEFTPEPAVSVSDNTVDWIPIPPGAMGTGESPSAGLHERRHPLAEVVIPANPPDTETPDSRTSIGGQSSSCLGSSEGKRHTDGDSEPGPGGLSAKRQRTRYCRGHSTQSLPAALPSVLPSVRDRRGSSSPADNRCGEGRGTDSSPGVGFARQGRGSEPSESPAKHPLMSSLQGEGGEEAAMALAAVVAHELYNLLIGPPTANVEESDRRGVPSAPANARKRERISNRGGTRARWSPEEDERLLSMKRGGRSYEEIREQLPSRSIPSLQQRYSILSRRSLPSPS